MTREYKKSGIVGRIYRWVRGYYPNTNTCDVRKVVLFNAPFKLVMHPTVRGRDFPLWALYAQALSIYAAMSWGWVLELDPESTSAVHVLMGMLYLASMFVLVLEVLAFLVWVVVSAKKIAENRTGRTIALRTPAVVGDVREHVSDWWDDFYHKVCKPVTWVD